ncbi:MAG TPA: SGNH/GDSL hydrolase family protein [Acidobacteriota bacterium]|nr:SGNH/GDSL hydrolase family protein [Acidobacteriota bacterium]
MGILFNQWVLAKFFSPDGMLSDTTKVVVALGNLICIGIGLLLFWRKDLKILLKIALSFASVLLVLALLEMLLSRSHELLFRDNPYTTGSYRLHSDLRGDVQTNSLGLRWREVSRQNRGNLRRVAFLGDSFTFGCCADNVEKSFTGLFDSRMRSQGIEVLNFGVPGYGLADMYLQLKEDVVSFRPETVFLMFFNGNDFRDTYLSVQGERILGRNRALFFKRKIPIEFQGSRTQRMTELVTDRVAPELFKLLAQAIEGRRRQKAGGHIASYLSPFDFSVDSRFMSYTFWSRNPYSETQNQAKNISLEYLDRIRQVCDRNKIRLMIVTIPYREQVYARIPIGKNFDIAYPQHFVAEFAAIHSIPYLDLLPLMRERVTEKKDLYFVEDSHLTNEGHRVVAEILVRFFLEVKLRRH